jgi:hypothetical protein
MKIKTVIVYKSGVEKSYTSPELPPEYTFNECVSELEKVIQPSYKSNLNGYLQLETCCSMVNINIGDTSSIEFVRID